VPPLKLSVKHSKQTNLTDFYFGTSKVGSCLICIPTWPEKIFQTIAKQKDLLYNVQNYLLNFFERLAKIKIHLIPSFTATVTVLSPKKSPLKI